MINKIEKGTNKKLSVCQKPKFNSYKNALLFAIISIPYLYPLLHTKVKIEPSFTPCCSLITSSAYKS